VAGDTRTTMHYVASSLEEDSFVPGRREFLFFRDLGVKAASGGRYGAVVIDAKQGMTQSTGWHYHECDVQMVYMLSGWAEMQFEDGTQVRVEKDGMLFIPGGVRHNEVRTSDDMQALEVTSPADMGTVTCERPEAWEQQEAR
jgi:quercetin dioxygenase-like cupin family protein